MPNKIYIKKYECVLCLNNPLSQICKLEIATKDVSMALPDVCPCTYNVPEWNRIRVSRKK